MSADEDDVAWLNAQFVLVDEESPSWTGLVKRIEEEAERYVQDTGLAPCFAALAPVDLDLFEPMPNRKITIETQRFGKVTAYEDPTCKPGEIHVVGYSTL